MKPRSRLYRMPEQHQGKDAHHSRTCRYSPRPSAARPSPRVRNLHVASGARKATPIIRSHGKANPPATTSVVTCTSSDNWVSGAREIDCARRTSHPGVAVAAVAAVTAGTAVAVVAAVGTVGIAGVTVVLVTAVAGGPLSGPSEASLGAFSPRSFVPIGWCGRVCMSGANMR
jgi:hypothetical protein